MPELSQINLDQHRSGAPASPAGLVLVLDGIGGIGSLIPALRYAAASDRLPSTVRGIRWGNGLGRWHADLTNRENHRRRARDLAKLIRQHRAQQPDTPVCLVGRSGGTAIVVQALEQLPAESVEAVVLIAPALAPDYDLAPALRAVRREVVVFWSPLDLFILGFGTTVFGTMDRVRCRAAGLVGFCLPQDGDETRRALYTRLRQVRWTPAMGRTGYLGEHFTTSLPWFLRKYVVPILRCDAPAS